ncbi:phosphoenolpyruvate carboxykinase (ATP) [Coprothermobacteraceae bacterium]|nr:phosphoenolpyruvate carboxykinase (ATP) [Coprothermobacteraceae bacterium]
MWRKLFTQLAYAVNPELAELRAWAKKDEVPNRYGIPVYHSAVKSRSAKFTEYHYTITPEIAALLDQVFDAYKNRVMVKVERNIGVSPENPFRQVYIVPKEYARLAFMMTHNNFDPAGEREPDIYIAAFPDWPERRILVFPNEHLTVILGSDYYGESKMAGLRMAMHIMREERGGLGLHAGSKVYHIRNANGELVTRGALIFGLSGTGKTTISVNSHGLQPPEGIEILQDDINMLTPRGNAYGTEKNFYVKTDSVSSTRELQEAVLAEDAILENVYVGPNGEIDFDNMTVSTNGRAVINRRRIPNTGDDIDLPRVDFFLFNTRRYDIPPVGRLVSPAQAAAFFMLGESTITSADDPNRVGETTRVVGFDPFIISEPAKSGNRLYDIMKQHSIDVYIVNTGKVGGLEGVKITPEVTLKVVENIARGTIKWSYNEDLGYEVAVEVPGVDLDLYDPYKIYGKDQYKQLAAALREDRRKY